MDDARARRVLRGLFAARGYTKLREEGRDLRATGPGKVPTRVVFCTDEEKLGIKPLRDVQERARDDESLFIVYRQSITSFASNHIATQMGGLGVECMELSRLQFDLMRHVLVPAHERVPPAMVRKKKIPADKLPVLLQTDPVARWHNWPPGTVVRITRSSPEGHMYEEYRVVRPA